MRAKIGILICSIVAMSACQNPQPSEDSREEAGTPTLEQAGDAAYLVSLKNDLITGVPVPLDDERIKKFLEEKKIADQYAKVYPQLLDPTQSKTGCPVAGCPNIPPREAVGDLLLAELIYRQAPESGLPSTLLMRSGGPELVSPGDGGGGPEKPDTPKPGRVERPEPRPVQASAPARQPERNPAAEARPSTTTTTKPEHQETPRKETLAEVTERYEKRIEAEKNPFRQRVIQDEMTKYIIDNNLE